VYREVDTAGDGFNPTRVRLKPARLSG